MAKETTANVNFNVDYKDELGFTSPNMHYHKFSELLFVLGGKLNFLVDDEVYHAENSCLIFFKERQLHTTDVDSTTRYTRYNTTFRFKYLSDILDYESVRELYERDCTVISLTETEKEELLALITPLHGYFIREEQDDETIALERHILCALLIRVNQLVKKRSHDPSCQVDTYINRVLDHIKINLAEKLIVEEIAEVFFVSRSKLMSDFKKATGITIGDYILSNRIKMAKELLLSGRSVSETAGLSGFVNASHFIRTFKKETGHTPLQYCRSKF